MMIEWKKVIKNKIRAGIIWIIIHFLFRPFLSDLEVVSFTAFLFKCFNATEGFLESSEEGWDSITYNTCKVALIFHLKNRENPYWVTVISGYIYLNICLAYRMI